MPERRVENQSGTDGTTRLHCVETRRFTLNGNGNNSAVFRLDGKNAVVTGGASGIGKAIAISFADAGASIHILEVDQKSAEETTREIRDGGGTAQWSFCDVSNQQEVEAAFRKIAGVGPIHILVNNAGVSHIG